MVYGERVKQDAGFVLADTGWFSVPTQVAAVV